MSNRKRYTGPSAFFVECHTHRVKHYQNDTLNSEWWSYARFFQDVAHKACSTVQGTTGERPEPPSIVDRIGELA